MYLSCLGHKAAVLAYSFVALTLFACGDDAVTGASHAGGQDTGGAGASGEGGSEGGAGALGGGGAAPAACTAVDVVGFAPSDGGPPFFGEIVPSLDGASPDYLEIWFAGEASGVLDLAPPTSLFDCGASTCVLALVDATQDAIAAWFVPTQGSLTWTMTEAPYYVTGSLRATLTEVAIDPETGEVTHTPNGRCLEIAQFDFDIQRPIDGWTCNPTYYDESAAGSANPFCDCACGTIDPDCIDAAPVLGCAPGQTCGSEGTCEGLPESWMCGEGTYDQGPGTGCQCGCGYPDPDCMLPGEALEGCAVDELCTDWGTCLPVAWTCDSGFYDTGFEYDCDCGCGALDPDCPDAAAASCDFCGDPGACNTGACPGSIDPVNNAVCGP